MSKNDYPSSLVNDFLNTLLKEPKSRSTTHTEDTSKQTPKTRLEKKALKDLTPEEYDEWRYSNCERIKCSSCPFYNISCDVSSSHSWVHHKDLYSDKFLNQTVSISVDIPEPPKFTKEEAIWLSSAVPLLCETSIISSNELPAYFVLNSSRSLVCYDKSKQIIGQFKLPPRFKFECLEAKEVYSLQDFKDFGFDASPLK